MNKAAMSAFRKPAQAGFTLIELIVVIVILGILAATALPRFTNLTGDARAASVAAARGAMSSAAAIAHSQFLVNPASVNSSGVMQMEGVGVTMVNGYPDAASIAAAAGITTSDYTILTAGASSSTRPTVPVGSIAIQPNSVATTPSGATCFVMYTQAAANGAPALTNAPAASACQ